MHWTDTAIILSTRKHGESAGVVAMLTAEHGLFRGLVRGIAGKKQCGIYQPGNQVEARWSGRLSEHLGSFSAELQASNAAALMACSRRLAALGAMCAVLEATLPEREQAPAIFTHFQQLVQHLVEDTAWELYYVLLELELLSHLGFRLELDSCAATGATEDLIYISPKSGRAVCAAAGAPYHDKLFAMPGFLKDGARFAPGDITKALDMTAYFLEKYVFAPHNGKVPVARVRFGEMVRSSASG